MLKTVTPISSHKRGGGGHLQAKSVMVEKSFGHEVQSFRDIDASDFVQATRSDLPTF